MLQRLSSLSRCLAGGICLGLVLGQTGCTAMLLGGGGAGAGTGTAARSSLAETVSARIAADPALAGQVISVSGQGSVVILRGRVATVAQRRAAEALARAVSGVSDVDNRLVIQSGS